MIIDTTWERIAKSYPWSHNEQDGYNFIMNDEALAAYFVHHLSEYDDNPNDLILEVCEKTGRSWTDVQAILERVQSEHEREITLRQSPVLALAAIGICLGGLGVGVYSVYILIGTLQVYSSMNVSPLEISDAFQALASGGYIGIGGLLIGAAMVLGSMIGMRKVWAAILKL
jgi:hypothetical protein